MKVLITGAAGVLGRAVTALVEKEPDVTLRLTDMLPLQTPHEFVQADLSGPQQAAGLCDGTDLLFHIAAIHPWKKYAPEQYLDLNIKGTYCILEAAANAGVKRVIYTSSVAAMGMACDDIAPPMPWNEDKPPTPGDLYGITKHVGEQFCNAFARQGKFSYIALRPGMFIPAPEAEPRFGLGLLAFTVHASDVAAAHLLALRSGVRNDAFVITAGVPFTREDAAGLRTDAAGVILKHYPHAAKLAERGVTLPAKLNQCYRIDKARRVLGYDPRYSFESWLQSIGIQA